MRCINRFLIYLIVLFLFDNRAIAANFSVAGGYLYDPSGAKFIPEGTNVFDYNTSEILQDSAGYPLRKIFPNINYIRVMVYNLLIIPPRGTPVSISYPSASNFKRIADLCQTTKIVCEFEDHSSNGGYWEDGKGHFNWGRSIPPTGKLLGSALAFWKEMATQFKDKPYAWIGSLNELGVRSYSVADINAASDYHLALYNAIRSTGNNNIVDFCAGSGCGGVGTVGKDAMRARDYADMTNVIWSLHAYVNDTKVKVLATLSGTTAPGQNGGPGCYGWRCAQTIPSKDGVMPVIFNEFGSTTTDKNSDTGQGIASAMIDLEANGVGSASFVYYNPNGQNPLIGSNFTQVDNGGYLQSNMPEGQSYTLTTWGKAAAKVIAANPYPGGRGAEKR